MQKIGTGFQKAMSSSEKKLRILEKDLKEQHRARAESAESLKTNNVKHESRTRSEVSRLEAKLKEAELRWEEADSLYRITETKLRDSEAQRGYSDRGGITLLTDVEELQEKLLIAEKGWSNAESRCIEHSLL